jgi:hypothetical protein
VQFHQVVFLGLWAGACSYAALRGGAPERIVAAAMSLALIMTWLFAARAAPAATSYRTMVVGVAFTDLALFGALVVVALASARFWPMLMASMQGCGMLGHLSRPLGQEILPAAYYATVAFWGFPMVILLAVATWRHGARLRRYGMDPGWVSELPQRYRAGWSISDLKAPRAGG